MPRLFPPFLGLSSLSLLFLFYLAVLDISQNLSPQGCRMSWMSPSYILQSEFDSSWSPLSSRYSLWLYREVSWDSNQYGNSGGVPVLFIPGNAGSSRQVRSIASSATRQFYSSPHVVAPEFESRSLKPLDFFAVEFNEDLSAFHGPTLESQITYTSHAISYILSLYPQNTQIIVMGHSMGGIVATSLLPSQNISAIITMSTPHTLPPARFDSRIDMIYAINQRTLGSNSTPIVSLCGGATDMMIPSESCVLPTAGDQGIYRRTVFTSALEGAWTGVGHREMVWCHQVRWRVARAALELGASATTQDRALVLDKWLRDGHVLPPIVPEPNDKFSLTDPATYETLPADLHLVLKNPHGPRTYLIPVPALTSSLPVKFVLFVSQGSIPPVSPQNPLPLQVSVHLCASISSSTTTNSSLECTSMKPTILKLIPNPIPGDTFPVPNEGTDESEGVVLYEADIPAPENEITNTSRWVGVRMEGADGRGWIVAGFSPGQVINKVGTLGLLLGGASVTISDQSALRTYITFPNLLSNTLLIYRLTPKLASLPKADTCSDPLLSPLIMHTSHPTETHYFPITNSPSHRILLHTHGSAPYIPKSPLNRGLNFVVYSSGATGCSSDITDFDIHVDWSATFGRWASRYPTTLASWTVGVVALVVFGAWGMSDKGGAPMPSVQQSLSMFSCKVLRKLLFVSFVVSFIPLPEGYYLGNSGEPLLSPIAPLLLLVATGLVYVSWWVLVILMWPLGKLARLVFGRRREETSVRRSTVVSMGFIFLLIFLFVPWQVAFLGCWMIHLCTCASSTPFGPFPGATPTPTIAMSLMNRHIDTEHNTSDEEPPTPPEDYQRQSMIYKECKTSNYNHNMHILLLMTWLLPLAAPVLAVWVRTLATAGLTTPFDGDHFFPNVAPFLVLVDFASWTTGPLFERQRFENRLSVRWTLIVVAITAFFVGPRRVYSLFDVVKVAVGLMVLIRIGPRYWGGVSWTSPRA